MNDRPAGRQRIRGRTRRRRDNQAVRAIAPHVMSVNVNIEIEHARQRRFIRYRVVQRDLILGRISRRAEFPLPASCGR